MSQSVRRMIWVLLLACAFSLQPARVSSQPAEGSASGETVYTIARDLMCLCPSCAGKALDQCEPGCHDGQELRDEVAAMMRKGQGREQILKAMAAAHGPVILGSPPSEGWGILAVAIPFACRAAASIPLWRFTRGRRAAEAASGGRTGSKRGARARSAEAAAPAAEDARVAAALKDFDF